MVTGWGTGSWEEVDKEEDKDGAVVGDTEKLEEECRSMFPPEFSEIEDHVAEGVPNKDDVHHNQEYDYGECFPFEIVPSDKAWIRGMIIGNGFLQNCRVHTASDKEVFHSRLVQAYWDFGLLLRGEKIKKDL